MPVKTVEGRRCNHEYLMVRTRTDVLLLGEWACLGVLAQKPAHGYDVAQRLAPTGDVGRVWSLSRSLTYRALEQLTSRGLIKAVGEERGKAGGNRTILALTRQGKTALRRWLATPVPHFRDVRSELVLKLVVCDLAGVDPRPMLEAQQALFEPMVATLATAGRSRRTAPDPVDVYRIESSKAALRYVNRMLAAHRP
jgi:DNA-binding PadR family transcriptional regulator